MGSDPALGLRGKQALQEHLHHVQAVQLDEVADAELDHRVELPLVDQAVQEAVRVAVGEQVATYSLGGQVVPDAAAREGDDRAPWRSD